MLLSEENIKCCQATPHGTLLEQIMNPSIPKSEREWAASREIEKLRMLLWLRHGCSALYGDDGEMQCGHCWIDFKRDTADSIEQKWHIAGYEALKA